MPLSVSSHLFLSIATPTQQATINHFKQSLSLEVSTSTEARPEIRRLKAIVVAQEIEERATLPPGVTVPTTQRRRRRRTIDPKRGMSIDPIIMVPAKRTTPHSLLIQSHIAPNHRKRIVLHAPRANVRWNAGCYLTGEGNGCLCRWRRARRRRRHDRLRD